MYYFIINLVASDSECNDQMFIACIDDEAIIGSYLLLLTKKC